MKVYLKYWDIDRHGAGCDCGRCNTNGKSYGVAIVDSSTEEPTDVFYAASEESAYHNAEMQARKRPDWELIPDPDGI